MPPALQVLANTWTFLPLPAALIVLSAAVYLRGRHLAVLTRPGQLPPWRAACFLAGLLALWIAIASPIDAFDDYLLAAHMVQHFLLMSIVPPLLVLGAPTVPLLRGLPRPIIGALRPVFAARPLHAIAYFLTTPIVAWLAMNISFLLWHIPAAFDRTLHSETVHAAEHLCFLLTSLLFWWVLLAPWPTRRRLSGWSFVPYLLFSDIVNTILSATLSFSGRVLYPSYAAAPRITRLSALQDQAAAGAEMWFINSSIFLIPVAVFTIRRLAPKNLRP